MKNVSWNLICIRQVEKNNTSMKFGDLQETDLKEAAEAETS